MVRSVSPSLITRSNQMRGLVGLFVVTAFPGLMSAQAASSGPIDWPASQSSGVTTSVTRKSPDSSVQYVSPGGSDLNDGVSWAAAKLTLVGACEALPGGTAGPPTCGKGTIYFADGVYAQPAAACGLWLMGSTDPNYSNPPPCWIKNASALHIVGVATGGYGPDAHQGRALLKGGSNKDIDHPAIWISGSGVPLWFENISVEYQGRGIVISQDSNHKYSGCYRAGSANIRFDNVTSNSGQAAGQGPPWTIGGCTFWIYFHDIGASGTDAVNTPTNDDAAAILFVPSTDGNSTGLMTIDTAQLAGGGIKYYSGTQAANQFTIRNVTSEAQHSPAVVWLLGSNAIGQYHISDIQIADPEGTLCTANGTVLGTVCAVENDIPISPENVVVEGAGPNQGVMILQGANIANSPPSVATNPACVGGPYVAGWEGFYQGCIYAQDDHARRLFGTTAVRFANAAATSPSSWTLPTGVTLTPGEPAPDGTSNAGRTTNLGSSANGPYFYPFTSVAVSAGDWLIAGVWSRFNSGKSWAGGAQGVLGVISCTVTYSGSQELGGALSDGNWAWSSTAIKILTVSHNPCTIGFRGNNAASTVDTTDYYGPVYFRIPANTIPDTEVQMIYRNLQSYDTSCPVETNCGLRGQILVEDHYGTLANCSSSSSPAICGSAAAGSVVVATDATSVFVKTSAVTANSEIILTFDSSLGTKLGVTCNRTFDQGYVTARDPGVGFTIAAASAPTTNPACFSYQITN